MAYLHKQGVFHGDLKASNVLVNHRGGHIEAKIADFGVSQIVQLTNRFHTSKHSDSGSSVYSDSSFSGIVGTTGWRAPEVSDIQDLPPAQAHLTYYRALPYTLYWLSLYLDEVFASGLPYKDILDE
ncbi:unnamed protein product [Sphagnum tenellum]